MVKENVRVVERFLEALKRKDLSDAPLADDVEFEDPMMGKGSGRKALDDFLSGFFHALDDVRIREHVSEGEFVVTLWDAVGIFGTIPVLEKFRIRNGKIVEFRSFYDPRPVIG